MPGNLILLVILLILSGFFSSSETALFSIGRAKAKFLAKEPGKANQLILKMKEDPHKLLTTILIGNNLVNIGASALATAISLNYFSNNAVGIATGIMTLLILVFGEIFPKSVATRNNIMIAQIVIFPIYWLSYVFYPVILFLNFIPMLTGRVKSAPRVTEEELMSFVEVVQEEGQINPGEKELINNIVKLDDINVSYIMTPSADMFVIDKSEEPQLEQIIKSGFTRIPVIDGDIDHIVGMVNIKDLFRQQANANGSIALEEIMREPYFVPENKKLDQLLNQFKNRKDHAAIVVNEYGEVTGIVTLEDVLEAIVGDIIDETDIIKQPVVQIRNKEWLVLGAADIEIINQAIHMDIPESIEYETFSGYVLEQIGKIPQEKEQIVIDRYLITIKEMDGNRIKTFIVKRR
ncbi:MAG: HlyC/CorC family transporter [Desulfobacteraceae bacterium]|nr:HlyC/CorC family transporter [Desulfobacteraceae bacterium]MBC2755999.1 HlyC/CorC family transporter [Desulfobacteraceae bacterium]